MAKKTWQAPVMVNLIDPKDEKMPLVWRLYDAIESIEHAAGEFVDNKSTRISGSSDAYFLKLALQQLRRIEGELASKFPLCTVAGKVVSTEELLVWRLREAVDGIEETVSKFALGSADSLRGNRNKERLVVGMPALRGIHAELEKLFPYELRIEPA